VEVRRALSAVCLLSLVSLQVLLMLRYNHLQAHAEEYFGRAWYTPYAPSALYFALCNVGSAVFYPLSARLNNFEMHATKVRQPQFQTLMLAAESTVCDSSGEGFRHTMY
jgi:hypothetical protein